MQDPPAILLPLFELLHSFYIEDYVTSACDYVSFVGRVRDFRRMFSPRMVMTFCCHVVVMCFSRSVLLSDWSIYALVCWAGRQSARSLDHVDRVLCSTMQRVW